MEYASFVVWRNERGRVLSTIGCPVWTELFATVKCVRVNRSVCKKSNQCCWYRQVRIHIHIRTKHGACSSNDSWKLKGNYCKNCCRTGMNVVRPWCKPLVQQPCLRHTDSAQMDYNWTTLADVWPWATAWPGLSSVASHTMKIFQYSSYFLNSSRRTDLGAGTHKEIWMHLDFNLGNLLIFYFPLLLFEVCSIRFISIIHHDMSREEPVMAMHIDLLNGTKIRRDKCFSIG
jgi:hypothetical protein